MQTPRRRVLFFDDDRARHALVDQRMGERDDVTHVYSVGMAADAMERTKFDVAFLDHDIEFGHPGGYAEPAPDDGGDLVDWMCSALPMEQWPERIVIHSWNVDGAKRMRARLVDAGHRNVQLRPFSV